MDYNKHHWGFEYIWADSDKYGGRMLVIKEGSKMPYMYHKVQEKTIFVLQGVVHLIIEGNNKVLNEKDTYKILPKIMHRIIAMKGDVTILEVGTKLEDDVVIVEK